MLPTRILQRQQANTCFLLHETCWGPDQQLTDCLSHCPRAQGARLETGCLSPHGQPQERGKGQLLWAFLLLSHPHCCHLLTFICYPSHYHEGPSCISYVRQDSPHSRLLERGRVFLKTGLTVAQNKRLTPVTVSQQAQTRCPLLLRWRLSPPTPDSIACQCLKSPFCLCHFISKTSFRLEESFSNLLIPQTMGRELLNSGSSWPLQDFLAMWLAALFFGCGRLKRSNIASCKTFYICVFKSIWGPVKRNELN